MSIGYTRQSSFIDGDVILAEHGNAEFNHILEVFDIDDGHNHDGTTQGGSAVPFIQKSTTGVYVDTSVPAEPKILFKVNGVTVNTTQGAYLATSSNIEHTPDGGDVGTLKSHLDTLDGLIGDAATDAANAAISANKAEAAAMTLGIPVYISDAGSYTISDSAENADIVFEGDGTLTLPTVLVKGRRFTVRLLSTAADKIGLISNPNFIIVGNRLTLSPGDGLEINSSELLVLEAIDTTTLEII